MPKAKALPTPKYSIEGRKLRPLLLEQVPTTLFDAPPGAENIRLDCECGHSYPPPWTQKLPFEFAPEVAADNTLLMPPPLAVPCPSCGRDNHFAFPTAKAAEGIAEVYGDDNTMHIGGRTERAIVYAFVAIHPSSTAGIQERMDEAKRKLRPHADPRSWAFHVHELHKREDRERLRIALSLPDTDAVIRDLASVLALEQDTRLVSVMLIPPFDMNAVVASGRPKEQQALLKSFRELALAAGITFVTELLTRQGWGAKFTLEAGMLDHEQGGIDWPVERIGRGLRFDLNFVHVCRGLPIGLPVTAKKAPIVELELADLVAFFVRRYCHKGMLGERTDFRLDLIGRVWWGLYTGGRIGTHTAVGYPHDHFFPPESG